MTDLVDVEDTLVGHLVRMAAAADPAPDLQGVVAYRRVRPVAEPRPGRRVTARRISYAAAAALLAVGLGSLVGLTRPSEQRAVEPDVPQSDPSAGTTMPAPLFVPPPTSDGPVAAASAYLADRFPDGRSPYGTVAYIEPVDGDVVRGEIARDGDFVAVQVGWGSRESWIGPALWLGLQRSPDTGTWAVVAANSIVEPPEMIDVRLDAGTLTATFVDVWADRTIVELVDPRTGESFTDERIEVDTPIAIATTTSAPVEASRGATSGQLVADVGDREAVLVRWYTPLDESGQHVSFGELVVGAGAGDPDAGRRRLAELLATGIEPAPSTTVASLDDSSVDDSSVESGTPTSDCRHRVQSGDSPESVSTTYGISVDQLLAENGSSEEWEDWIVGTVLVVPCTSSEADERRALLVEDVLITELSNDRFGQTEIRVARRFSTGKDSATVGLGTRVGTEEVAVVDLVRDGQLRSSGQTPIADCRGGVGFDEARPVESLLAIPLACSDPPIELALDALSGRVVPQTDARVAVANLDAPGGMAGAMTAQLAAQYPTSPALNALPDAAAGSVVYHRAGHDLAARHLAERFGIQDGDEPRVRPMPDRTLVDDPAAEFDVLIIIGDDTGG